MGRAALWVYPLLFAITGPWARRPVSPGSQVAIPFLDGLLLGTVELCELDDPQQGPTITTCRAGSDRVSRLRMPFAPADDALFIVSVNTFVSRWELFDDQRSILGELDRCEARFAGPMDRLRRAVALGYPDADAAKLAGVQPFTGPEVEEILSLFERAQAVFDMPEWRQHAEGHRRPTRFLHQGARGPRHRRARIGRGPHRRLDRAALAPAP